MSIRLFLVLSVLAAFTQGVFFPVVFFEGILIVFLIISRTTVKIPLALFTSGFIFDLLQNQTFGITPLIFLIFGFLLNKIKDEVLLRRSVTLAFVIAFLNTLRLYFVFGMIFSLSNLFVFLFGLIIFKYFYIRDYGREIKIK